MNHSTVRKELMPDYAPINWDGIKITAHPLGWRGLPILRIILAKVPLFSGSLQVFCVHMTTRDKMRRGDGVRVNWFYNGPSIGVGPDSQSFVGELKPRVMTNSTKFKVATKRMMASGEGTIVLQMVQIGDGPQMGRTEIIGFDVKSSDTLMLIIFGLLGSLLIAAGAAWFGASQGRTIAGVTNPIPVVIVEEPPTLPSAPTGGNP